MWLKFKGSKVIKIMFPTTAECQNYETKILMHRKQEKLFRWEGPKGTADSNGLDSFACFKL